MFNGMLVWFFLLGLIIGSFLNVLIARYRSGESFMRGRSQCPHCKHTLELLDLIPIFSFIGLRGKCRYCGKKISWQYPLVELATGLSFVGVTYYLLLNPISAIEIILWLAVASLSIVLFVCDLKWQVLPDRFVGVLLGGAVLIVAWFYRQNLFSALIGLAVGGGVLGIIYLVTKKRAMGLGDVKLMLPLGLLAGWPNVWLLLLIAFVAGAIVGVFLIASKKADLKTKVPFGAFLLPAFWVTLFWGNSLVSWYINLGR